MCLHLGYAFICLLPFLAELQIFIVLLNCPIECLVFMYYSKYIYIVLDETEFDVCKSAFYLFMLTFRLHSHLGLSSLYMCSFFKTYLCMYTWILDSLDELLFRLFLIRNLFWIYNLEEELKKKEEAEKKAKLDEIAAKQMQKILEIEARDRRDAKLSVTPETKFVPSALRKKTEFPSSEQPPAEKWTSSRGDDRAGLPRVHGRDDEHWGKGDQRISSSERVVAPNNGVGGEKYVPPIAKNVPPSAKDVPQSTKYVPPRGRSELPPSVGSTSRSDSAPRSRAFGSGQRRGPG